MTQIDKARQRTMTLRQVLKAQFILLIILTFSAPSWAEVAQIKGCEAMDMREILKPSDDLSWESQHQNIGNWNFFHRLYLYCDAIACTLDSGLGIEKNRDTLLLEDANAFPLVFSQSANSTQDRLVMPAPYASAFAEALGPKAFEDSDGALHRIWVDYGVLNDAIMVRARTEVICQPLGGPCEIETQVITYVPYDEHHACGYLSQEDMLS